MSTGELYIVRETRIVWPRSRRVLKGCSCSRLQSGLQSLTLSSPTPRASDVVQVCHDRFVALISPSPHASKSSCGRTCFRPPWQSRTTGVAAIVDRGDTPHAASENEKGRDVNDALQSGEHANPETIDVIVLTAPIRRDRHRRQGRPPQTSRSARTTDPASMVAADGRVAWRRSTRTAAAPAANRSTRHSRT